MMVLSTELVANVGKGERGVSNFVEQVKKELRVGKIYAPVRIVWARKPSDD